MVFFSENAKLTRRGKEILEATWQKFPSLAENQIALTWIICDRPVIANLGETSPAGEFWQHPLQGFHYRGEERIYPASVVKLFYLVATYEWLARKAIAGSEELDRAITDMIVDSSNDATSLVVDVLTGTTSGPELPREPFQAWQHQRNAVNRYFQSLGWEELANINVNQKTWSDGPYGREKMFVGRLGENRNMLTTDAVARILYSIIAGVAVSGEASQKMRALLQRDLKNRNLTSLGEEKQIKGFLGENLPDNARLWSKAGWTSQVRHDAAYIEIEGQKPYLLIAFTEGKENSQNRQILPFISQLFAQGC